MITVAIQGQAGSFHDYVTQAWYKDSYTLLPCATFADMFDAYDAGEADAIVTAVENSLYGSINEVYQRIELCEAPIIGEYKLAVDQNLIAAPGAKLSQITEIYSHPVALAQCRHTLQSLCPEASLVEFFDTAGAVEYIKDMKSPSVAAVASEHAAKLYDMPILKASVQDEKSNFTRFLILQNLDTAPGANRASLVITTNHKPGALVEVLELFAKANINLAKLQSQPIIGKPWHYKFFVVVDTAGTRLRAVTDQIEQRGHEIALLGEYVKADVT